MNKIIIIGNGFDLAHGLKTDYSSFIKWYIMKAINRGFESKNNGNEILKFVIEEVTNSWIPKEKNIESLEVIWKLYSSTRDHQDFNHYFNFNDRLYDIKVRLTSKFLTQLIQHQSNLNWVDIEMMYYQELKIQLKAYLSGKEAKGFVLNNLRSLNSDFESIKVAFEFYLYEISNSAGVGDLFIDEAKCSIDKLHILNEYYLSEEGGFKNEDYEEGSERYIPPKRIIFLSFNYTGLLKDLNYQGKFEVINIHGQLNNNNNPIIFGYGDEMDEDYLEMEKTNARDFLTNIKSFGYFNNSNYSKLVRAIDSEPFVVDIWGHSCGLSDRTLLNMIFEHDNCVYIRPYYWKKSDTEDNYVEITQNISRHFNDKRKMRNRVLNKTNCSPLLKL